MPFTKKWKSCVSLPSAAVRNRQQRQMKEAEDRLQLTVLGISELPVEQAYQLSRAFAFYFELINLAETNHRKRSAACRYSLAETARGSAVHCAVRCAR